MNVSLVMHDHLVHFYHLHGLDWCDITEALKADPKKQARLRLNTLKTRLQQVPMSLLLCKKKLKPLRMLNKV